MLLVLGSTPRCRASRSSKRSLRRGAASVTAVSCCRATGGRDHTSARPRWPWGGACPPSQNMSLSKQPFQQKIVKRALPTAPVLTWIAFVVIASQSCSSYSCQAKTQRHKSIYNSCQQEKWLSYVMSQVGQI